MKKIMLMARDPGGANTIIPLVRPLQQRGYEAKLYGKDFALLRYREFGLEAININDLLSVIDISSWIEFLLLEHPDFIITGTSGNDFSERYLWEAARKIGIRTFAIMDQWMNYGVRFSKYSLENIGEYVKERENSYLPDKILLMDDETLKEMLEEGFNSNRLLVSGQPYFELLMNRKKNINTQHIEQLRREIGCQPFDFLITYISEPLSQTFGEAGQDQNTLGYDEKTILQSILNVLKELLPLLECRILVAIKRHPREQAGIFMKILGDCSSESIRIMILPDVENWSLLMASDLVCGMSSMLLLEAFLLDKPVLSVQIGLKQNNPFVLNRRGIVKSILQEDELRDSLENFIFLKNRPVSSWKLEQGADEKVICLMEEYLCHN